MAIPLGCAPILAAAEIYFKVKPMIAIIAR